MMQLTEAFFYVLLTISVTATCVQAENQKQELSETKTGKRISKRDAAVLIDNFPLESIYSRNPKVIYRRISNQKYRSPKPKYGPTRITYGPPRPKKISTKKFKPYGPPSRRKRPTKPRHGPPKHRNPKLKYGPPKIKKIPQPSFYRPEPAGFGEPPADYPETFQPPIPTHVEPPVDSYGAPLKSTTNDPYPDAPSFPDLSNNFENHNNNYQSWQLEQHDQNIDNSYAFSKNHPAYVKPNIFDDKELHAEDGVDPTLDSYADVFRYGHNKYYFLDNEMRPESHKDGLKVLKRPWRAPNLNQYDDQIIVGGQYAEPPGRYVPKFQSSAPMYVEGDDFSPPDKFLAFSSTFSPYVNYKNSNMAFSPQNLNDAFSIVDK